MSGLAVWMYGQEIGLLSVKRRDLVFGYTAEALDAGLGRPLLSVSMPTRSRPYSGAVPRAFFDGLLPEGEARRIFAYDFGVDEGDVVGLLTAIGRDCAGALVIIPEGESLAADGAPEAITEGQVAERLRTLRFHPLGVDQRVRVSLAGVQEKLLLARSGNGWGLPVDGAPSTHILKPAHEWLTHSVANEAFCMRVARHLGILAANVEVQTFAGVRALVIERYDRTRADGQLRVLRLHQEDLCQAHAVAAQRKYEEGGGPSLRDCAHMLESWSQGREQREQLLDITTLNVLVGNAGAHAKNLSLLHDVGGQVRLAPAYDVMSTVHYPTTSSIPGMFVNGVRNINEVTREDLIREAIAWGLQRGSAAARVERLLVGAEVAIALAAEEINPPGALVDTVLARARALNSVRTGR